MCSLKIHVFLKEIKFSKSVLSCLLSSLPPIPSPPPPFNPPLEGHPPLARGGWWLVLWRGVWDKCLNYAMEEKKLCRPKSEIGLHPTIPLSEKNLKMANPPPPSSEVIFGCTPIYKIKFNFQEEILHLDIISTCVK